MDTTIRPTIDVDKLDLKKRPWPPQNRRLTYDEGARFCFRLGKCEGYWQWPWPQWIGIPDKSNVKEWTALMNGWMTMVMDPANKENVELHIIKLLPYI